MDASNVEAEEPTTAGVPAQADPAAAIKTIRIMTTLRLIGVRVVATNDGLAFEPAGVAYPPDVAWLREHPADALFAQTALGNHTWNLLDGAHAAHPKMPRALLDEQELAYVALHTVALQLVIWLLNQRDTRKAAEDLSYKLRDELGVTLSQRIIADVLAQIQQSS